MSLPGGNLSNAAHRSRAAQSALRRSRCAPLAVALACAALCSCAERLHDDGLREWIGNGFKVGPDYCKPPAPVADDWIKCDDQEIENRQIVDWWTVFDDPKLNELIETAYRQNLSLRVAGTRVLQARAQQAIAVGGLFPQSQQAFGEYSRVNLSPNEANNPTLLSTLSAAGNAAGVHELFFRLADRLQPELGARFLGPFPAEHRIGQRRSRRVGGRLRRGARDAAGRRGGATTRAIAPPSSGSTSRGRTSRFKKMCWRWRKRSFASAPRRSSTSSRPARCSNRRGR